MWGPQNVRQPAQKVGDRTGFYGFGWNIDYDTGGRLVPQHSGAFSTGAATNVLLVPSAGLGIISLTNADPVGVPEAVNASFVDAVKYGQQSRDWLSLYQQAFKQISASPDTTDYSKPPANATPARADDAYVGTYTNDYYGPVTVAKGASGLTLSLGPKPETLLLKHYSGGEFFVVLEGETAGGYTGMTFAPGSGGSQTLTIPRFNDNKLGVFTRSG